MSASRIRTRSRRSGRKSLFAKGGFGRRMLCWLLGIAAGLLVLLLVGYYQVLAYLQSDSFRSLMEEKLSNRGRTERVSFDSNLDIDGSRLALGGGEMLRRDVFRRVAAENISADWQRNRLWDGCLAFSKIGAESLSIEANLAKPPTPPAAGVENKADKRTSTPQQERSEGRARLEIGEMECRDTNLLLCRGEGSLLSLQHCAVKATPTQPGNFRAWDVVLSGGKATTSVSLLREFGVKVASASIDERRIRLQRCALQLTPGVGELRAAGDYSLRDKVWQAQLEVTKADLGMLLSDTWRQRVRGTLFANLRLSGKDRQVRSGRGDVSLSDAVLEGLPILSELPLGNTTPYRTVELEVAECAIVFPFSEPQHHIEDAWLFDHIDVRAKGDRLRVTGRVLVGQDKQLAGTLRIGLPESAVAVLESVHPAIVQQIFNAQGAPGFRWLTVNLSGTLEHPVEDLSARISQELLSVLPQAAGKAADQAIRSLGGALSDLLKGAAVQDAPPAGASSSQGKGAPAGGDAPAGDAAGPGASPAGQQGVPVSQGTDRDAAPRAPKRRVSPSDIIDSAADSAAESLQRGLRGLF